MAKKSRRSKQKGQSKRLSPAQMVRPRATETSTVAKAQAASSTAASASDLKEEYRYVVSDLKRIAVLAAIMLVVLIALALLLT